MNPVSANPAPARAGDGVAATVVPPATAAALPDTGGSVDPAAGTAGEPTAGGTAGQPAAGEPAVAMARTTSAAGTETGAAAPAPGETGVPARAVLPLVLSSEELRAAARLTGRAPLPVFAPAWADDELGVADAVAVRGLLARGLATVRETPDGPDVVLTSAARSALGPLLEPDELVEVHRDAGPAGRRTHVFAESAFGRVRAAELRPSLWEVETAATPAACAALHIAVSLLPPPPAAPADGTGEDAASAETRDVGGSSGRFLVSGTALASADRLLGQDGAACLPEMLRGDGLDEAAAAALAVVLVAARALVTVRTVRRVDAQCRAAGAVTWLDAGEAGLWLVTPAEPATAPAVTAEWGPAAAGPEVFATGLDGVDIDNPGGSRSRPGRRPVPAGQNTMVPAGWPTAAAAPREATMPARREAATQAEREVASSAGSGGAARTGREAAASTGPEVAAPAGLETASPAGRAGAGSMFRDAGGEGVQGPVRDDDEPDGRDGPVYALTTAGRDAVRAALAALLGGSAEPAMETSKEQPCRTF